MSFGHERINIILSAQHDVAAVSLPVYEGDAETFHTLDEAAAISRRSPNAMRQLRVKGRGPRFIKVDGRLIVTGTELRRWMAGESPAVHPVDEQQHVVRRRTTRAKL
jgi:hypothetical protein